jgi:hypothetical protein
MSARVTNPGGRVEERVGERLRDESGPIEEHGGTDGDGRENTTVDLARLGWLGTVLACLIAVVILLINGYDGYAGVTFAVALSAAINLK